MAKFHSNAVEIIHFWPTHVITHPLIEENRHILFILPREICPEKSHMLNFPGTKLYMRLTETEIREFQIRGCQVEDFIPSEHSLGIKLTEIVKIERKKIQNNEA